MGEKEESRELVRNDMNLKKWAIFAPRKHTKERTLTRITTAGTQQVKVGVMVRDEKAHTLTAADGKAWYALLKRWEDTGRPTDRPINFTLRSLCRELNLHYNSNRVKELKERMLNLHGVQIRFVESYKIPDGEDTITTAFTLLSNLSFFERRKKPDGTIEKYFGFSEFTIHKTIMDTILKKGMKPVRLDVIRTLKNDCAFILYRYLDLILFGKPKHEEDLLEVAEICGLEKGQTYL